MNVVNKIFDLFARHGEEAYFAEPVSQLEHALQTAWQAEQARATDSLIAAALLHDIGHLLHKLPEDIADQGIDAKHERVGGGWLARHFSPAVAEPVKLHVTAKRYLCAVDAAYQARLSPASIQSLALQGGVMDAEAVHRFEQSEFYREAIALRQWDDEAKIVGLTIPPPEDYRAMLTRLANR
jgi:gamma-butyrobetaine dioxygenase